MAEQIRSLMPLSLLNGEVVLPGAFEIVADTSMNTEQQARDFDNALEKAPKQLRAFFGSSVVARPSLLQIRDLVGLLEISTNIPVDSERQYKSLRSAIERASPEIQAIFRKAGHF